MRTVRDEAGRAYLLLEVRRDTCRVRDPATGVETLLARDALDDADEGPLVAAARALLPVEGPPLDTIADDRTLGLLVHLVATGPHDVLTLLDVDALCESALHGMVGELRAAGLLEETRVDGRRGYRATDRAREAIASSRE